jgi:hypothetical protein
MSFKGSVYYTGKEAGPAMAAEAEESLTGQPKADETFYGKVSKKLTPLQSEAAVTTDRLSEFLSSRGARALAEANPYFKVVLEEAKKKAKVLGPFARDQLFPLLLQLYEKTLDSLGQTAVGAVGELAGGGHFMTGHRYRGADIADWMAKNAEPRGPVQKRWVENLSTRGQILDGTFTPDEIRQMVGEAAVRYALADALAASGCMCTANSMAGDSLQALLAGAIEKRRKFISTNDESDGEGDASDGGWSSDGYSSPGDSDGEAPALPPRPESAKPPPLPPRPPVMPDHLRVPAYDAPPPPAPPPPTFRVPLGARPGKPLGAGPEMDAFVARAAAGEPKEYAAPSAELLKPRPDAPPARRSAEEIFSRLAGPRNEDAVSASVATQDLARRIASDVRPPASAIERYGEPAARALAEEAAPAIEALARVEIDPATRRRADALADQILANTASIVPEKGDTIKDVAHGVGKYALAQGGKSVGDTGAYLIATFGSQVGNAAAAATAEGTGKAITKGFDKLPGLLMRLGKKGKRKGAKTAPTAGKFGDYVHASVESMHGDGNGWHKVAHEEEFPGAVLWDVPPKKRSEFEKLGRDVGRMDPATRRNVAHAAAQRAAERAAGGAPGEKPLSSGPWMDSLRDRVMRELGDFRVGGSLLDEFGGLVGAWVGQSSSLGIDYFDVLMRYPVDDVMQVAIADGAQMVQDLGDSAITKIPREKQTVVEVNMARLALATLFRLRQMEFDGPEEALESIQRVASNRKHGTHAAPVFYNASERTASVLGAAEAAVQGGGEFIKSVVSKFGKEMAPVGTGIERARREKIALWRNSLVQLTMAHPFDADETTEYVNREFLVALRTGDKAARADALAWFAYGMVMAFIDNRNDETARAILALVPEAPVYPTTGHYPRAAWEPLANPANDHHALAPHTMFAFKDGPRYRLYFQKGPDARIGEQLVTVFKPNGGLATLQFVPPNVEVHDKETGVATYHVDGMHTDPYGNVDTRVITGTRVE